MQWVYSTISQPHRLYPSGSRREYLQHLDRLNVNKLTHMHQHKVEYWLISSLLYCAVEATRVSKRARSFVSSQSGFSPCSAINPDCKLPCKTRRTYAAAAKQQRIIAVLPVSSIPSCLHSSFSSVLLSNDRGVKNDSPLPNLLPLFLLLRLRKGVR
jgi:hypothetical protein